MLAFVRESRRLDVARMQRELGVRLRFPTLDEGLADAIARDSRVRSGAA
jgi:nucleoside-diphosphate-sugar epimerase